MSFLVKEIFLEEISPTVYRITLIGGKKCYIENVLRLIEFSDNKMIFMTKRGKLIISGKNLSIENFTLNDVIIDGVITSILEGEDNA